MVNFTNPPTQAVVPNVRFSQTVNSQRSVVVGGRARLGTFRCAMVGLRSGGTCLSRTLFITSFSVHSCTQGAHTCVTVHHLTPVSPADLFVLALVTKSCRTWQPCLRPFIMRGFRLRGRRRRFECSERRWWHRDVIRVIPPCQNDVTDPL